MSGKDFPRSRVYGHALLAEMQERRKPLGLRLSKSLRATGFEPTTFWSVARQTLQYSCGFAGISGTRWGLLLFPTTVYSSIHRRSRVFRIKAFYDRFFDSYIFSTWGQIGDTDILLLLFTCSHTILHSPYKPLDDISWGQKWGHEQSFTKGYLLFYNPF